jgi:PII-like signaling protein
MHEMAGDRVATRIMVFFSEEDRVGHRDLEETLLERARADGMAGATIWRAVEGFGASGRVHTGRFPDAGSDVPVALEVIDAPDRIDAFLEAVRAVAPTSFVTSEEIRTTRFGPPA